MNTKKVEERQLEREALGDESCAKTVQKLAQLAGYKQSSFDIRNPPSKRFIIARLESLSEHIIMKFLWASKGLWGKAVPHLFSFGMCLGVLGPAIH